jgi:hypothetical protein
MVESPLQTTPPDRRATADAVVQPLQALLPQAAVASLSVGRKARRAERYQRTLRYVAARVTIAATTSSSMALK